MKNFLIIILCLVFFPKILFSEIIYFPEEEESTGFLKLKSEMFSFGAELETEYLSSQGSELLAFSKRDILHQNETKTRFRVDQFVLIPQVDIKNKVKFFSELEFRTSRTGIDIAFLREAHVTFFLPYSIWVRLGIDDRFISPEWSENPFLTNDRRYTEAYPIAGVAFWKDESLSLQLVGDSFMSEKTNFLWRLGVSNGLALDHDELTRNTIYPIFQDDRDVRSASFDLTGGHKEYAGGIGLRHRTPFWGMGLLAFIFNSNLSARDIDFLGDVIPQYTSRSDKRYRMGLNYEVEFSKFNLFSQYIYARDGLIKRHGAYLQPSVVLFSNPKGSFLNEGIRFLYRFNILDINIKGRGGNISTSPFTWDRVTHTFAVNTHFHPYIVWRNEYHMNREETGSQEIKEVPNDEFLSQLEFRF